MERLNKQGKWDKSKGAPLLMQEEQCGTSVKDDVDPSYEEYLLLLQQKNRLLKKLKEKDDKQIEMERREQGFVLYVSGANSELGRASTRVKSRATSRHSKTASDAYNERKNQLYQELKHLEKQVGSDIMRDSRLKTAPTSMARKGWRAESVQIKTKAGTRMKVKAPGKLSGKYSEDFEQLLQDDYYDISEEDNDDENDDDNDDDDDDDDDDEGFEHLHDASELVVGSSSEDDGDPNQLTLSFSEVKALRRSLEADQSIQESIEAAKKRIAEEKEGGVKNNSDDEDGEEIKEELELANDSIELRDSMAVERLPRLASDTNISNSIARESVAESDGKFSTHKKSKSRDKKSRRTAQIEQVEMPTQQKEPFVVLQFSSTPEKNKERVLSATRRKDVTSEDVAPKPSKSDRLPKESQIPVSDKNEVTLASSPVKTERPLSASKRSKPKEFSQLDNNVDEVLKAMKQENKEIDLTQASGSRTAPEKFQESVSPLVPEKPRPSSIGACTETDKTINLVTEKVRKMNPRQQRHLISLLAKLEQKEAPFNSLDLFPVPRGVPMRATAPVESHISGVWKDSNQEKQEAPLEHMRKCDDPSCTMRSSVDKTSDEVDGIDVNLEISSNWGDPCRIGLTEVQFYSDNGKLVPYEGSDVSVSGHVGDSGVLKNLSNRKTKTTKERYMWSCEMEPGHPVELVFHLREVTPTDNSPYGISKICIWNYNKGMKDLVVGAKDARLFIGGELLWEGTIDKGCGNQVFDYCKVIILQKGNADSTHLGGESSEPQPVREPFIRSETVTLERSADIDERIPVIEPKENVSEERKQPNISELRQSSDPVSTRVSPKPPPSRPDGLHRSPRSPRYHLAAKFNRSAKFQTQSPDSSLEHGRLKDEVLHSLLKSEDKESQMPLTAVRSSSTPNLSSSTENVTSPQIVSDEVRGNSAALPAKPPWLDFDKNKNRKERPKSRPIWLNHEGDGETDDRKRSSSVPVKKAEDIFSTRKSRSRPTSGRRSNTPGRKDLALEQQPDSGLSLHKEDELDGREENVFSQKDNSKPRVSSGQRGIAASSEEPNIPLSSGEHGVPLPNDEPGNSLAIGEPGISLSSGQIDNPLPSGEPDIPLSSGEPNKVEPAKRGNWRRIKMSLEESLDVLSMFERSNRGRITHNLDLTNTGDALDEFLSSEIPRQDKHSQDEDFDSQRAEHPAVEFEIPHLPVGKKLLLNIKDTWGDRYYVGLNGIEVFTDTGRPAEIAEITADPADINVLPEYGNDPRVITNVVDGVYRTRDDLHLWLAPFTPKGNHFIQITFPEVIRVAMIRIWNYNKSRIHSFRGAKDVEITLDGSLIFRGEIARACGDLGAGDPFGDTILFTMDEDILDAMAYYDQTYELAEDEVDVLTYSGYFERPATADRGDDSSDSGERPFTCAGKRMRTEDVEAVSNSQDDVFDDNAVREEEDQITADGDCLVGQILQLNFVSTWGDLYYLGLTGLEVLDPNVKPIPLTVDMIDANPRDLNDLPEYGEDDRTLDKLVDGCNVVMSDEHMWLIPFTEGQDHTLTIDLGQKRRILGFRVWNYNKSQEDTFRGARQIFVSLDGRLVSPPEGYLLRKGPGNVHFDFAQDIYFLRHNNLPQSQGHQLENPRRPESRVDIQKLVPDYEVAMMPRGFVYQFQLLSTWGDPYYIGLNGLEFYDENGYRIHLTENNVTAFPHSVNVLEGVSNDARTPDKLVDGVNDSNDGRHMWLAPILPGLLNLIYIVFDEPVTVSMIKIWNYSKTPMRGVCAFGILVDDLLVYHGEIPQVPSVTRGILPNLEMPTPHHTVFFTDKDQFLSLDGKTRRSDGQDVQLTNDNRVLSQYSAPKKSSKTVDPALRPKTSVPLVGQPGK